MSGILLGLAVFVSAYIADLLAHHWGFQGRTPRTRNQRPDASTRRRMSSRLKGHAISPRSPRSTGIRSP